MWENVPTDLTDDGDIQLSSNIFQSQVDARSIHEPKIAEMLTIRMLRSDCEAAAYRDTYTATETRKSNLWQAVYLLWVLSINITRRTMRCGVADCLYVYFYTMLRCAGVKTEKIANRKNVEAAMILPKKK